jgi:class 3 adenylate cyclase/tetratricopeptide (TPR) repeat protein
MWKRIRAIIETTMSFNAPSRGKPFRFDMPYVAGVPAASPVENIAVLFTDIVGSTLYFKRFGDARGRQMLRRHQEIASDAITGKCGSVVKVLGDSVMAYFRDPRDALRAAATMEERFSVLNKEDQGSDIRVRIGVHFGAVIIEEKDIYGDVVNVAAKLTSLADGTHTYISREVYDRTHDMPFFHFEVVNLWHTREVPEGLTIYRVLWDRNANLGQSNGIFLYARFLSKVSSEAFACSWEELSKAWESLWGGKTEKVDVLPDGSLFITLRKSGYALQVAVGILDFLRKHVGEEKAACPVQMIVYSGEHGDHEKKLPGITRIGPHVLKQGCIYISEDVCSELTGVMDVPVGPERVIHEDRTFFRVLSGGDKEDNQSFLYRGVLTRGVHLPCFYCGDRKHQPLDCPSKTLPDITRGLGSLGYLSVDRINRLFFRSLVAEEGNEAQTGPPPDGQGAEPTETALYAFYDLNRVFQLRFLKAIWYAQGEDWNRIRDSQGRSEGGLPWLAQDSLRVGDLAKAEAILADALERYPHDYKVHCAMGYLDLERGEPARAECHLSEALTHAATGIQKLFILLLLARLSLLEGNMSVAARRVQEALALDPACPEASYLDIAVRLREGKEKMAIQRLVRLIEDHREYYVQALIDPELFSYRHSVDQQLVSFLSKVEREAQSAFAGGKAKLRESEAMLKRKQVTEVESLLVRAEEMLNTGSCFGFQDTIRWGTLAASICGNNVKERQEEQSDRLRQLRKSIEESLRFIREYKYPRFARGCMKEVLLLKERIDGIQPSSNSCTREEQDAANLLWRELCSKRDEIEPRFRRLELLGQFIASMARFTRNTAVFLSIILFTGLAIFPLAIYYLNVLLGIEVALTPNMWIYQKPFLVLGGIAGVCVAFLRTIRNVWKG